MQLSKLPTLSVASWCEKLMMQYLHITCRNHLVLLYKALNFSLELDIHGMAKSWLLASVRNSRSTNIALHASSMMNSDLKPSKKLSRNNLGYIQQMLTPGQGKAILVWNTCKHIWNMKSHPKCLLRFSRLISEKDSTIPVNELNSISPQGIFVKKYSKTSKHSKNLITLFLQGSLVWLYPACICKSF